MPFVGFSQSKSIMFEKIVFHTSACLLACPIYHLEINKDKKAHLYAELIYNDTSLELNYAKMGYFDLTVNDTLFRNLVKEVESIDIDNLKFDGALCCDESIISIIVYYDGKRKVLQSMYPPDKAKKMINLLYEICQTSKSTKATKEFEIEETINSR